MKKFIKPSFERGNVNISATLAEFLGAPNRNATLPEIEVELKKNYKNVVFICFDGMGIYPLTQNLPQDDFLLKNTCCKLTSTFPSTTVCATTSLITNKLPLEHGMFGWSMYVPELDRNIDVYKSTDSWTGESVNYDNGLAFGELEYYFDRATKNEYEINTVFPPYIELKNPNRNHTINSLSELFVEIKKILGKDKKQFVYAYTDEPDKTMHINGVRSAQAKGVLKFISDSLRELAEWSKDTLFVVTSDHGQIDNSGFIELYKDAQLYDMLKIYPYMYGRTACFKVKPGKEADFEGLFNKNYGEDYVLFKSKDMIKDGYFGNFGDKGELLGDYIAVANYNHRCFVLTPVGDKMLGDHNSLTEEMEVPLILIKKK